MSNAPELSVGVTPWLLPGDGTATHLSRQAERAEALGFASFFLPENHFSGSAAIPEPLMLLSAVAANTERIRLGTTSYLLPVRHPLQAAEQVAVLDRLSNGRVTLGVGRGVAPSMFSAFKVSTRDKRKLFEQSLNLMRRAWQGEAVSLDGSEPVEVAPRPVQEPHPPIWVAAFGPLAIRQAGRLGLPYLASPMESVPMLRAKHERHREAMDEAGFGLPDEVPLMRTVFVSRDASVLKHMRERLERSANVGSQREPGTKLDDWAIVGEPAQVREGIARYREEFNMTHLVATRLRIGAVEEDVLERSVNELAEVCFAP
ncbi:MAG: LLM class flavin-dependent oxidoreductase [Pseudomonadales bacterium]